MQAASWHGKPCVCLNSCTHVLTGSCMPAQALTSVAENTISSFVGAPANTQHQGHSSHGDSVQGQMSAALGGAQGMQAAALQLQAAFLRHAQQASTSAARLKHQSAHSQCVDHFK